MTAAPLTAFLELRSSILEAAYGDGGDDVCAALTSSLDEAVAELADDVGSGAAVVALGGYGRREQCLSSDIDIMLLHRGGDAEPMVRAVLYPLWDTNLKVGHAVRTVDESRAAADERLDTLTSLLSSRLVAGDRELFDEMLASIVELIRMRPLTPALVAQERERRRADPYPTMTADLKEGRGALRTHQGFWWERRRAELIGVRSDTPGDDERSARATLLATRNALHAASGRGVDRFVVDLREPAATWLGTDVRALATDLTHALHTGDKLADHRWPDLHAEQDAMIGLGRRIFGAIRSRFPATEPETPEVAASDTVLALAVTAAGRSSGAWFTAIEDDEIRTAVVEPWTAADRHAFVTLLSGGARGRAIFGRLEELGWVHRVFPEWETVATAPQIVPFHDHPVGTHLWRAVDEMLLLIRSGETKTIADEVDSTEELLLASFLHDIGKGHGGHHEIVGADLTAAFLRRAGYGPATVGVVSDAVRLHLLLSETATRRDIADPAVIDDVAGQVRDIHRLRVLYLLTIADLRATGTTVWNEWRATLIRSLFERVSEALETGAAPRATRDVGSIMALADGGTTRRSVEEHVDAMPDDYLDTATPDEVLWHLTTASRITETPVVAVDPDDPGHVLVVGADRPGFLLAVCRAFTANGVEVMDARLRIRSDSRAFATFHARTDTTGDVVGAATLEKVSRSLAAATGDEHDLRPAVRNRDRTYRRNDIDPAAVEVRAHREGRNTVIEVRAPDRLGLLADIVEALNNEGLDIQLAKIDTMGGEARDLFHVRRVGVPIHVESELSALLGRLRDRLRG